MKVIFTDRALQKITEKLQQHPTCKLLLKYDTEDCGCSTDGIPVLQIVSQTGPLMESIETNGPALFIDSSEKIYFDQKMSIDAQSTYFLLKSDNQYLNPRMSLIVKQ